MGQVWNPVVENGETWGPIDKTAPFNRLGPIADPISPNDAATKEYVDSHSTGGNTLQGTLAARPIASANLAGATYVAQDVKISYLCQQTAVGVYAWVTISQNANASWATQIDWSINASTGSDVALGTTAAPLATWAELRRRCLAVGGFSQSLGNVNIGIVGNLNGNDPMDQRGMTPPSGDQLNIKGTAVVIFSGSITAFAPKNPGAAAGGSAAILTDSAIPVSWTSSGGIGKIGVIQGGARDGAIFIPAKDLGGKQARISDPILNGTANTFPFASTPTFPTLQVGDAYTVFSCPIIDSVVPDVSAVAPQNGDGASFRMIQQFIQVANATNGTPSTGPGVPMVYIACILPSFLSLTENYYGCALNVFPHDFDAGYYYNIFGGCAFNSFNPNGSGSIRFSNFLIQGGGGLNTFYGAFVAVQSGADLGIFDSVGPAYKGAFGGILDIHGTAHFYGGGNATFGIILNSSGVTYGNNKPTVTGTNGDVAVDGVARGYSTGIPYADPTTGSFFCLVGSTSQVVGTFSANGATPVTVACPGIQTGDIPVVVRTALTPGTPGMWAITGITPGVSFTFQGTAADLTTFEFRLK